MIAIFLLTYSAVFAAEIAGDKLLYTTGVLATRYRTRPIVLGMTLAFMAKMGAAVAVGQLISNLSPLVVGMLTSISILWVALALWRKDDHPVAARDNRASKAAVVSFAAILLSEWGDVGQVTAATLAARYGSPFIVWLGAVAAMVTKGGLAAFLGAGVRRWIAERVSPLTLRYVSVGLLILLGALSIVETAARSD